MNKVVDSNISNEAANESSKVIMTVERQLVSTREISLNIAEQILYYAKNDDVNLLLSMLLEKYSFLNAIHVNIDSVVPGIKNHNYYIVRDTDSLYYEYGNERVYYCIEEQNIFDNVINSGKPSWSQVFSCERNENNVVSFYSPVRLKKLDENLKPIGSVICELSLQTLNDSINNFKIKERGYAFLVSEDGTFLTHPNKELIFKENLKDIPDNLYDKKDINIKNILSNKRSGTAVVYSDYLQNERCWVKYTPIIETGWMLIILIPQIELNRPLYLLILRMLFFSVLGILIIFYIITYISNHLIQPLSLVTTQLKKFSSFSGESDLQTMNEIKMVSESLDYLQLWYEKFKINQQEEQKLNYQRKQDLLEASEIQMSLINTDFSLFEKIPEIDLYAIYKPARIVSGDLFDFFLINDDNLFFSIGDVSGKGISAAFFMSVAQTIIKNNGGLKKPGEIVNRVNNELYTANHHQFFLTLFIGILNLKTGKLTYCNAAHTSAIILNSKSKITELGQSHGLPLGIYPGKKYMESTIQLNPNDTIILYTDGIIELQNDKKEIFGLDNFHESVKKLSNFKPMNLLLHIETELEEFKNKTSLVDDVTIMAIKYYGKKKA